MGHKAGPQMYTLSVSIAPFSSPKVPALWYSIKVMTTVEKMTWGSAEPLQDQPLNLASPATSSSSLHPLGQCCQLAAKYSMPEPVGQFRFKPLQMVRPSLMILEHTLKSTGQDSPTFTHRKLG